MKKVFLSAAVLIMSIAVFSQQITQESLVINIEVPVRVYKGNTFVDNLTIDDFEILDEGIPQKIEAVYLIKKKSIERKEEKRKFSPEISRNFFLFFEISEYTSKLGDAISYFIHNKIISGDNIIFVTPLRTYRMVDRALDFKSKEELAQDLKEILYKDSLIGFSEYRNAVGELMGLAEALSSEGSSFGQVDEFTSHEYRDLPLERKLMRYGDILNMIENLRRVDQQRLLAFAEYLKNLEGQKYVFMFYQREFIPQIEPRIIDQFMTIYQDSPGILRSLSSLYGFFRRETSLDLDLLKKTYADSSVSIHFLFITTPPEHVPGIYFHEQSEDIYSVFREMSRATGGYMESSANPDFLFRRSVEASENYYLLYYSPLNYNVSDKFIEIKVRVKNKDYRVIHRLGYFAD
ncbi:hypothetical protein ES703_37532 [subsurface metagenome]